jgi:predicted DNA repair protein MutK
MPSSLLLLLDDIATVLDDVAAMTKVAVKKTAGVLGDDLALNAKQVSGVAGPRELPVVWAVAKGSAVNKAILVPAALVISWLAPWLVTPLLVVGGLYLCYEGTEKLLHRLLPHAGPHSGHEAATGTPAAAAGERNRIGGAIRTDFILSAEIIVISLGVVAASPPVTRAAVLVTVAVAMTVGVYGLVAAIVKLDDLGAWLAGRASMLARGTGLGILAAAPVLMRLLAAAGTAAMFLVGGGIVVHAVPLLHHAVETVAAGIAGHVGHAPGWPGAIVTAILEGMIGLAAGGVALALVEAWRRRSRPVNSQDFSGLSRRGRPGRLP